MCSAAILLTVCLDSLLIMVLLEYCWNVYPSTRCSSLLLLLLHAGLLLA